MEIKPIDAIKLVLAKTEVAFDLMQALHQQTRTTKLDRRERALAYLIENATGDPCVIIPRSYASVLYDVADQLKKRTTSPEVGVACDRAMKRIKELLNSPSFMTEKCVACGDLFTGSDHHCDPKKIAHKDAAMKRDDTIMEIS